MSAHRSPAKLRRKRNASSESRRILRRCNHREQKKVDNDSEDGKIPFFSLRMLNLDRRCRNSKYTTNSLDYYTERAPLETASIVANETLELQTFCY